MARECDNIHIAALALAVGIPICVENCQQSGELHQVKFPAYSDAIDSTNSSADLFDNQVNCNTTKQPPVTLLYRPGHYDILYPI